MIRGGLEELMSNCYATASIQVACGGWLHNTRYHAAWKADSPEADELPGCLLAVADMGIDMPQEEC